MAKRTTLTVDDVRQMLKGNPIVSQAASVEPVTPTEPQPPVTVETVLEEPLQTTETVEIVDAKDAPTDKPAAKQRKTKAQGD